MEREIEVKLLANSVELLTEIEQRSVLAGAPLTPTGERMQEDTYLDTPDFDLLRHLGFTKEQIQAAGRIIMENCREVDTKARFGGDEFFILMPHTEPHEAMMVAERIRQAFAEYAEEHARSTVPLN